MAVDAALYVRTVLEPARAGRTGPPRDLYARYAIVPAVLADPRTFQSHIRDVVRAWSEAGASLKYRHLVEAMRTMHGQLEADGTLADPTAFREARDRLVGEGRRRVEATAKAIASANACVTASAVTQLVRLSDGLVSESEVRADLAANGVAVVEPYDLSGSVPTASKELRATLDKLEQDLSLLALFGDKLRRQKFRVLDGLSIRETEVAEAIVRARAEAGTRHDDRSTALSRLASIVEGACRKRRGLEDLVIWELVELVRPAVDADLPQRAAAAAAVEVGLEPAEAARLVLSVQAASGTHAARAIEEALAAGRLREAEVLAAALPAAGDQVADLVNRVRDAVRGAEVLVQRADDALADGRSEDAAVLLTQAARAVTDDVDLAARVARLPPPPPFRAVARPGTAAVVVSWEASPARVGEIAYILVRSDAGPVSTLGGGTEIGRTDDLSFTDLQAPPGRPLWYAVFARRGAAVSAASAVSPVVFTPEVVGLRVMVTDDAVSGSWTLPAAATGVEVTRQPGIHGQEASTIRSSANGFVDDDVSPGTTYSYRVRARYVGADGEVLTSGVRAAATVEGRLPAVGELNVEVLGHDGRFRAEWPAPPGVLVQVRVAPVPPRWTMGTRVPVSTLDALGEPVPTAGGGSRPSSSADIPPGSGRRWVTVVTVGAREAVVGASRMVVAAPPVEQLQAERLIATRSDGDLIEVKWVWPADVWWVRLRWWSSATPGDVRTIDVARPDYTARGCRIPADRGHTTVSVEPVVEGAPTGQFLARSVHVEGLPPAVRYSRCPPGAVERIRRGGRAIAIELEADEPCTVPPVGVWFHDGLAYPTAGTGGERVGGYGGGSLDRGVPARITCVVARGAQGWLTVRYDGAHPSAPRLVPRAPHEWQVG